MSSGKSETPKSQWGKATKGFKKKKAQGESFWQQVKDLFGDQGDFSAMGESDKVKVRKSEAEKIK